MRLDLLAALSGVLIALQARANGELSHRLDNGLQAAVISFGSGLIIIFTITLFNSKIKAGIRNLRTAISQKKIARWKLFAGSLGGSFIAIQTQIVPLIGVAIFSVASIAGQTAMSLIVDRIGLTGGGKKLISPRRVAAALLTVLAVLVSVWDRIDANNLSMFAVAAGVFAGAVVGVQRALNGEINEYTDQSFTTSLLNFMMGCFSPNPGIVKLNGGLDLGYSRSIVFMFSISSFNELYFFWSFFKSLSNADIDIKFIF
jgi:transporter family-2 protein